MSPMEKQFPVGRSGFAISRRESGAMKLRVQVAFGLVVGLYWLVHFRTSVVPTGSLGQDDVREIVSAVSRKRWELIRTTATRREFKLLSRFLRARIESVHGETGPNGKAFVACRAGFDPASKVLFHLQCEGTTGWAYERCLVVEN